MKTILMLVCCLMLSACGNIQTVSVDTSTISYQQLSNYFPDMEYGDILFIQDYESLTTLAIPGRFKHVSIYLGHSTTIENSNNSNNYHIYDASSSGVCIRNIDKLSHLKEESTMQSLCVLRLKENVRQFMQECFKYKNKPYDYQMRLGKDALYCSELLYYVLEDMHIARIKTTTIFDRKIVTPGDIYDSLVSSGKCEIVLEI